MEQNILEEIANLQKRYNDKLQEYEQASLEHKNHIRKYGEICNDAKFEKCADERARCEITGEKTVRFGISPNMYTYANHNQPILCTKSFFNNVKAGSHSKKEDSELPDIPNYSSGRGKGLDEGKRYSLLKLMESFLRD